MNDININLENFLSKQLQKFSVIDLGFVMLVYFVFGLLTLSLYQKLSIVNWLFYFVVTMLCTLPLWAHLVAQDGDLMEKMKGYVKTNNPSNQVLLFFSMFFFAMMLGTIFSILTSAHWLAYIIIMGFLAIKPTIKTWFW